MATVHALVARCLGLPRPLLVGLDVDGVLAPIVAHASHAVLLEGIGAVVADLAALTPVAVVSGRSLADLDARFGFGDGIAVVGSHGLEVRGAPAMELSAPQAALHGRLAALAAEAADRAGAGAWVEHKPASVVLHVREAAPDLAAPAVEWLLEAVPADAHVKHGHAVVELFALHTSKADAIARLRAATAAGSVLYVGDDRTDEEVFATLAATDLGVRVGGGESLAGEHLADPVEVRELLVALAAGLRTGSADRSAPPA
jgi:trehalose-phosphatase